jgi:hypothetical protein
MARGSSDEQTRGMRMAETCFLYRLQRCFNSCSSRINASIINPGSRNLEPLRARQPAQTRKPTVRGTKIMMLSIVS